MIRGEEVPLIIFMRKYVAGIKPLDIRAIILEILRLLTPMVEELQKKQWAENTLKSGSKMGNYAPATIKRYKKSSPVINLYETGEMYKSLKAKVDETLNEMFHIKVESPRWASNYEYLAKNSKIGVNDEGEPGFMGLTEENTKIVHAEFIRLLQQRLNNMGTNG